MSDGRGAEALRLVGIEKTYNRGTPGAVEVLRGVDLSLAPGEIAALVAPSGSGKSTLLHIAGLLEEADAGQIFIGGEAVAQANDAQRTRLRRARVGFVYQFHHLLPEFTARENIALPQRAAGVGAGAARARASRLLEAVDLAHRGDHRPAELSGGEQQRVAFCRALANAPDLLLADEPTGNLDPETSSLVFQAMVSLARETGLAALVATHNPQLAARMDRTLVLRKGILEQAA
ncbi:MAG: ABC transporter ATP-binding protein [Pseudomonadota bacterium]